MSDQTVFLVDDDPAVRDAVGFLLRSVGIATESFDSADAFISSYDPTRSGCLVLDIRMPGMSGLELQEWLEEHESPLPVIFLSGHGDVPMTVRGMRKGAVDFIEKPCKDQQLLESIRRALATDDERRARIAAQNAARERFKSLSDRERQVLDLFVSGKQTKQIAKQLDIREKTVAAHRSRLYEKLGVDSIVDLVHLAAHAGTFRPNEELP
ncbi:MAG: response regulator [Pirellulaceae bacterium]|jgi:FixJ family two-component response regulator|nr:response regulator [Pirellulaceae bacterium]